jgi:hypothetical protein
MTCFFNSDKCDQEAMLEASGPINLLALQKLNLPLP